MLVETFGRCGKESDSQVEGRMMERGRQTNVVELLCIPLFPQALLQRSLPPRSHLLLPIMRVI